MFAERLIAWQFQAGRHDLPWQNTQDPYAIWVSEIMLQQTQVHTVLSYYPRFMARFPSVDALAGASLEAVLAAWSGLGYYRRAHMLHACAQTLGADYGGVFPQDAAVLVTLPGIGRSTAAAIAALAWGHREAILDGNVKRVLCRVFGVEGWPGLRAVEQRLWQTARAQLPAEQGAHMRVYTQGLMDLGALVCTPVRPDCARCPMAEVCVARAQQRQAALPAARPPRVVGVRKLVLAMLVAPEARVLIEHRPSQGIWAGLWSLPEWMPSDAAASEPYETAQYPHTLFSKLGCRAQGQRDQGAFRHRLTHVCLDVQVIQFDLFDEVALPQGYRWIAAHQLNDQALPSPIKAWLERFWLAHRAI
jgi:A/G-specific adenine glycosylase